MIKEIIKLTLEQMYKEQNIDCNQYQGEDFKSLEKEIRNNLDLNILRIDKIYNQLILGNTNPHTEVM
jgi:hypothetical protein